MPALRRTAPANVATLIDLAVVKAHLRVTHDTEDTLIPVYLAAAARTLEAQTGRSFGAATWTLTLDALPSVITLERPSVTGTPVLKIIDADGVEQTVAAEAIKITRGDWFATIAPASGHTWPSPAGIPDAVTVTFVEDIGAIEGDLKAALLLFVGHLYRNREAVSAESLHEVPMAIASLIAPYRTEFV